MLEKGKECAGKAYKYAGVKTDLKSCAAACSKSADVFTYGTNEFGTKRCYGSKGCRCYCYFNQVSQCRKNQVHKGYNVYRQGVNGKIVNLLSCSYQLTIASENDHKLCNNSK